MFTAEDTLKNVRDIDIVCTASDGEYVMLQIVRSICSGKKVEELVDIPDNKIKYYLLIYLLFFCDNIKIS